MAGRSGGLLMLGLYIHIPFCSAICNYCNFNRGLFDGTLKRRYVEALRAEILESPYRARPADTIYFGGGTPSLLEPEDVADLVGSCRASFHLTSDAEITLEANPESVSVAKLASLRQAGINRVSIGVQSFRGDELQRLTRLHSADRAREAYAEAREARFDNVSLDLMMWLPVQQIGHWLESVDEAIRLAPDHLSLYMLEVYPNAPLKDLMARSTWSQAPDEDVAEMYLTAMERLDAAGYTQYEISNVAVPGRASRHNLKYWTDGDWIGFGCGAHSTCDGVRWKNVASTEEYVERKTRRLTLALDVRTLSSSERLGDALFTGLRLSDGIDAKAIGVRYGVDVLDRFGQDLQPYVDEGLLLINAERLRLTRRGMLLAHEVMSVFV
jgi:oxygen-independent coproporphyrinogen-3 oxidase